MIRCTGAFPYAVKDALRGTDGLGPIADTLPRAELEWVLRSEHPPLSIATRITARLVKARDKGLISDITLASLDHNTCSSWLTTSAAASGTTPRRCRSPTWSTCAV